MLGRNKLSAETLTGSILFCPFYSLCIPVGRHLKTRKNSRYLKNFLFLMFSGAKTDRRLCTYGKGRKAGLFLGKKCFFHFLPSSTSVDINFKPGWLSTVRRVKDLVLSSKKVSNRCSCNLKQPHQAIKFPKGRWLSWQHGVCHIRCSSLPDHKASLLDSSHDPYFILCFRGR